MAELPLIALRGVKAGHGAPLFGPLDLSLAAGARLALIGRNGAGKSTLMSVLAGLRDPDEGERWKQPGVRLAHLLQDPPRKETGTAFDLAADQGGEAHRVRQLLYALDIDPELPASGLSGGQARRAALAGALATDPDILLLDEPTNHMDIASIAWLEGELARFKGALLLVSHDRAFLRRVATGMLWLDRGKIRRRDEGFERFERWMEEVEEEEAGEAARLSQSLKAEERYRERGVTARRKRNQRRVAKLSELRAEKIERGRVQGQVSMAAQDAAPGGRLVVEAESVAKRYGDKVLFQGFSTRILRGDRIGIVGPNGAGKTTLIRVLTGALAPDEGSVKLGANIAMAHVDQNRAQLDPHESVMRSIDAGSDYVTIGGEKRHVAGYLGDFLFSGPQLTAKVSTLSGGERNRLLLAKVLAQPCNLLVLDEPTNDLDMDTLDVLEAFLADWPGTLILVSHDRDFLDRTVTSVIGLDGEGGLMEVVGGWSEWEGERARLQGERAPAAKKGGAPSLAAAKPKPSTAKLSYKDQRELENLPGEIKKLETTITKLNAELADAGLYAKNPSRFAAATAELDAAEAALGAKEERWLELEEKREALASGAG